MSNNGTARLKYLVTDAELAPFAWERKKNKKALHRLPIGGG